MNFGQISLHLFSSGQKKESNGVTSLRFSWQCRNAYKGTKAPVIMPSLNCWCNSHKDCNITQFSWGKVWEHHHIWGNRRREKGKGTQYICMHIYLIPCYGLLNSVISFWAWVYNDWISIFTFANIFLEIKIFSLYGKTLFIYPVRTSVYESRIYVQCAWYAIMLLRRNKLSDLTGTQKSIY